MSIIHVQALLPRSDEVAISVHSLLGAYVPQSVTAGVNLNLQLSTTRLDIGYNNYTPPTPNPQPNNIHVQHNDAKRIANPQISTT
jgi:hypothetical protein